MPDGPLPSHGRRALRAAVAHPRRPSGTTTLLPDDLADLLLDGEHSPHPVATLLAAARGPATAHELSGEAAARQAFADAAPLATPVPLPTDRERRGRHRRIRAVRTVVTAKLVGVAALTLTAGGVAVAATGPSGAPAEERVSGGTVPSADAEPGAGHDTGGRAAGSGHTAGTPDRAATCGPVTGAAIADLARECGDARVHSPDPGPDEHRTGPGPMAFGSPYASGDVPSHSGQDRTLVAPPTAPVPTTTPTAPSTALPPPHAGGGSDDGGGSGSPGTQVPDAGSGAGSGSGSPATGSPGSGSPGSGSPGSGSGSVDAGGHGQEHVHPRDDAPRRGDDTTNNAPTGETRTPVTGRDAPPSP
ncbi:hypothetical protein PSU4_40930 [Pseudonocardia sulfidoxydans NBRC 16205]|uniref:Uncharacterized protein n=1 Tax=Pseudonocardia sulfidoxydans NBRC 16205 TaxID=1223511 RepID=A0A511DJZ1_9PSEU|nr:hypothetical protein [Pseudonocardia sulfidoxydans]GEL25139.1 hypothetical protein PSU4_40930 [Pseudonocardia sulfidoxydans NBRC 16205]